MTHNFMNYAKLLTILRLGCFTATKFAQNNVKIKILIKFADI